MSLHILGGKFKGRELHSPKGTTRPSTAILRKALFDMLYSSIDLEKTSFLDLFAGSGAVGLEALSRGATFATFCENDTTAFRILKKNIEKLGVEERCRLFAGFAHLFLKKCKDHFDIIYIDPPYAIPEKDPSSYHHVLKMLDTSPILKKNGLIFVENTSKEAIFSYLDGCKTLVHVDSRHFSNSWLHRLIKI